MFKHDAAGQKIEALVRHLESRSPFQGVGVVPHLEIHKELVRPFAILENRHAQFDELGVLLVRRLLDTHLVDLAVGEPKRTSLDILVTLAC